jgi:hypothetical protein
MVAPMNPSSLLSLLLLLVCAVLPAGAQAGAKRPLVVELFTSQGCSSCPPADAMLSRLADRRDLLALSLPVTYWDMLGWRDTLASDGDTRRQKAYAAAMGRGGIYTPQLIVDGVTDVVGSREAAIDAAIAARQADQKSVPVELRAAAGALHIGVGAGDAGPGATLWLLRIMSHASVAVGAGENSGHVLSYRNVVRDIRAVGIWRGQPLALDLPHADLAGAPHDTIVVILQESGYGRILGVAVLTRPELPANW